MDLGISDKRALVTGSSSGLGRAIALRQAAEGATVVVHGRNPDRKREVVAPSVPSTDHGLRKRS